jgi:hypothetical protein
LTAPRAVDLWELLVFELTVLLLAMIPPSNPPPSGPPARAGLAVNAIAAPA